MAARKKGAGDKPASVEPRDRTRRAREVEAQRSLQVCAERVLNDALVRVIEGYVGVLDGRPVFETVNDSHGDVETFDIYKTRDEALERWAWARKVYVVVDVEDLPQAKDRGEL
jgi:hypothetical protein